jgi:hypothetical protein
MPNRREFLAVVGAALALDACESVRLRAPAPGAGARNPTGRENTRPGSPNWEITTPAEGREIEGYASATSVERGQAIDLFVSTVDPSYRIDVFRMGWYGGAGARRVAGPIDRAGLRQPTPPADPVTGLVECHWREPYRLSTADGDGPWPSGVYLARLTASRSGRQSYIVFVVRDDARRSALVFQSSVTTFAAYNNWGGRSLYAFNSGGAPARKVSFDRPYAINPYGVRLDGAGDFLRRWEYNTVRWLEREGFDVAYLTDVDTHTRGDLLFGHRVFLSVGHDEYWSWAMREHVEAARDRGVHLAFLGANACFWQIRLEPGGGGAPDRTVVAFKDAVATDPVAGDPDPDRARRATGRWRDAPTARPESALIGIMYLADPVNADVVVDEADHWAFTGTGLSKGSVLPGLLGHEVDAVAPGSPAGLRRLAHSPFTRASGETQYADMTIHESASGALVFATGSMYWNWGLDGYNAPQAHPDRVSAAAQQITRNVLTRMLEGGRGSSGAEGASAPSAPGGET